MNLKETVDHLNRIAPLEYAASWDNVGLIIDPSPHANIQRVLLTIDTTSAVLEEAIRKKIDLIISYHPILFHPIQSLSRQSPNQSIVIELLRHNIALYSPHTALDHITGGVNDWLVNRLGSGEVSFIQPLHEDLAGVGRKIVLDKSVSLTELCQHIKQTFNLSYLRIAKGSQKRIKTIACCPGAGASLLRDVNADCFFTGEMSHHEVLAAQSNNTHVILSEHTHTERGYLSIYRKKVQKQFGSSVNIDISKRDKDPLQLI
jgi:dinuclear metal center YbgI/SA1388 family protein